MVVTPRATASAQASSRTRRNTSGRRSSRASRCPRPSGDDECGDGEAAVFGDGGVLQHLGDREEHEQARSRRRRGRWSRPGRRRRAWRRAARGPRVNRSRKRGAGDERAGTHAFLRRHRPEACLERGKVPAAAGRCRKPCRNKPGEAEGAAGDDDGGAAGRCAPNKAGSGSTQGRWRSATASGADGRAPAGVRARCAGDRDRRRASRRPRSRRRAHTRAAGQDRSQRRSAGRQMAILAGRLPS